MGIFISKFNENWRISLKEKWLKKGKVAEELDSMGFKFKVLNNELIGLKSFVDYKSKEEMVRDLNKLIVILKKVNPRG